MDFERFNICTACFPFEWMPCTLKIVGEGFTRSGNQVLSSADGPRLNPFTSIRRWSFHFTRTFHVCAITWFWIENKQTEKGPWRWNKGLCLHLCQYCSCQHEGNTLGWQAGPQRQRYNHRQVKWIHRSSHYSAVCDSETLDASGHKPSIQTSWQIKRKPQFSLMT